MLCINECDKYVIVRVYVTSMGGFQKLLQEKVPYAGTRILRYVFWKKCIKICFDTFILYFFQIMIFYGINLNLAWKLQLTLKFIKPKFQLLKKFTCFHMAKNIYYTKPLPLIHPHLIVSLCCSDFRSRWIVCREKERAKIDCKW
jgi:hypothetical protein